MATGRDGVWRILHYDFISTHEEIVTKMEEDLWNFQPVCENFMLVELRHG